MTNDGREIPARIKLIDDPQGAASIVGSIDTVIRALGNLAENDAFLKQAEDAEQLVDAAERANIASGSGSGGSGGGRGKFGRASQLVGQAAVGAVGGEAGKAIGTLTQSIATLGATGAVVGVGMIALDAIMGGLRKASEEANKAFERQFDSQQLMNAAMSDTTANIESQIEALEAQKVIADRNLASAQAAHSAADRDKLQGALDDARNFTGIGINMGPAIGAATDKLEEMTDAANAINDDIATLTASLDLAEVAANDAAEALEKQAEAQEAAALKQADAAGNLLKASQDAAKRDREGNIDRLKAIKDQKQVIETQINSLKASGVATEAVTAKIDALTGELKSLGDETEVVTRAVRQGTTEDRKAAQERAKERAQERAEEKRARAEARRERKLARMEEEHERIKDAIDFANKVKDIEFKTAEQKYNIALDANRNQERLLRESKQQLNQDFFQDFLGLFTSQNQLAFNLQETQIAAGQNISDADRSGFLDQQRLRANTPGAQQLLGGPGGSGSGATVTINTGLDPNAVGAILQDYGVIPNG